MTASKISRQEALVLAGDLSSKGASQAHIREKLIERGMTYPEANAVLARLASSSYQQNANSAPEKDVEGALIELGIGFVVVAIALGIAFFTYQAESNGASFVLLSGSLVYGITRIYKASQKLNG